MKTMITDSLFNRFFPAGFSLKSGKVLLRPLQSTDITGFLPITQSSVLWQYFTALLNDEAQLQQWIADALHERSSSRRVPFTIIDKSTGNLCGSTSFGNVSFYDKRIEIGWSWLGEQYLGSGINQHCKYALLQYAFEEMQCERVEMKTDYLNERARQALRKIGAVEEGVLRSHMQMPANRRRDSIFYSILKSEWKGVKEKHFADFSQT